MYERFIEAAEKGKTVTCDATRDTSGINIDNMAKKGLVKIVEDEQDYLEEDSDIEMRKITLIPDKEKIEEELKVLEAYIKKAEERNIVYRKSFER